MAATNRAFTIRSYIFQKILGPGDECLVRLQVQRQGGRAAYLTKILRVNEAPKTGNCSTDPQTGELSNTEFRIFCDGWSDPDTPLRYSFSYGDDEKPVLTSLENPTSSRKFRIYKQVPEETTSITIPIKVVVEDALGMSSKMQFHLEVLLFFLFFKSEMAHICSCQSCLVTGLLRACFFIFEGFIFCEIYNVY